MRIAGALIVLYFQVTIYHGKFILFYPISDISDLCR